MARKLKYITVQDPDLGFVTLECPEPLGKLDSQRFGCADLVVGINRQDDNGRLSRYTIAWTDVATRADWDLWRSCWPCYLVYLPASPSEEAVVSTAADSGPEWTYRDFTRENGADVVRDALEDALYDVVTAWTPGGAPYTGGAVGWCYENDSCRGVREDELEKARKCRTWVELWQNRDMLDLYSSMKAAGELPVGGIRSVRALLARWLESVGGMDAVMAKANDFAHHAPCSPLASLPAWAYRIGESAVWYWSHPDIARKGAAGDEERAARLDADIQRARNLLRESSASVVQCAWFNRKGELIDEQVSGLQFEHGTELKKVVQEYCLEGGAEEVLPEDTNPGHAGPVYRKVYSNQTGPDWRPQDKGLLAEPGDVIRIELHVSEVMKLFNQKTGCTEYHYRTELGRISLSELMHNNDACLLHDSKLFLDGVVVNGHIVRERDFHVRLKLCEMEDIVFSNIFDSQVYRWEIQDTLDRIRHVCETEEEAAAILGCKPEEVADDRHSIVLGSTGRIALLS